MNRERMTKEEFIAEAKVVHGDKYDYSLVNIVGNNKSKVKIKCNVCGCIFEQTTNNHLSRHGCPECAGVKKITKETFIKRAKEKHGNKYDYSLVKITGNNKTKIKIKCNTCETIFEQKINNHLNGSGCPNCARRSRKEAQIGNKEDFIAKAKEVHGDKYTYDKVEYDGNDKKVIITCPIHGDFPVTPHSHKNGRGCPLCARERNKELQTDTLEEFIAKAKAVHGNKYSYDKTVYVKDSVPVFIACPIHGYFKMTPHNHKAGCGCQKCNQSHLEEQTRLLLEKNNIEYEPQKTFPWLKNKREMPLDFYLPEYNIAIECQGEQHYLTEDKGYFTKAILHNIQQRDVIKQALCQGHGIPIYYIRYDENVEERISEIIKQTRC